MKKGLLHERKESFVQQLLCFVFYQDIHNVWLLVQVLVYKDGDLCNV